MRFFSGRRMRPAFPLFSLAVLFFSCSLSLSGATIGSVVPVIGQVSDLLYDSTRNLVYLANPSRNEIEVYSLSTGRLTGSIRAGIQPASLAMSPDGRTLYAANIGSFTISAIDLNTQRAANDYTIGSRPDAIAVGSDGKVVILGTAGLQRLDTFTSQLSTVPVTPGVATPAGLPNVNPAITPATFFASLVTTASGNLIIGLSAN